MTKLSLDQLLENFSNLRVLIVGDVMVDSYIWGRVTRISPEAPVPVVAQNRSEFRMGGAANVALNVHSLGAQPVLCSVIGQDSYANIFLDLLKKEQLTTEGIIQSGNRITTVKTRVISGSQHLLRIDHETEDFLDSQQEHQLFDNITGIINKSRIDAIIFQDYDKGAITPGLIERLTGFAASKNIPTLVDPKKRNFGFYKNNSLFKPNFKEFVEGLNIHLDKKDFDSMFNAAKLLHNNSGFNHVMITLSELGIFISNGEEYHVIPAEVRDIADVSGAGDTVISMAALCYASGLPAKQTAALCNLAGGLVCERVGVVTVEREQLLKESFVLPE